MRDANPGFDPAKGQAARYSPYFITVAMVVLGSVFFLSLRLQVQGLHTGRKKFLWSTYSPGDLSGLAGVGRPIGLMMVAYRMPLSFDLRQTVYCQPAIAVSPAASDKLVSVLRGPALASSGSRNLPIDVVGLSVGTLAAYAVSGDYLCFYEINPNVIRIA